jgi:hypothetical protein
MRVSLRFGPQLRNTSAECKYCITRHHVRGFMCKREKTQKVGHNHRRGSIVAAPAVVILPARHAEIAFFGELKPCVVAFGYGLSIEHHIEPCQ